MPGRRGRPVTQLGTLSTKVTTVNGAGCTIPNALMVSQTVTNLAYATPIGCSWTTHVPWLRRGLAQVEACCWGDFRTPASAAIRRACRPSGLEIILRYPSVLPERPRERRRAGHCAPQHPRRVQRYGVQITSPNYGLNPAPEDRVRAIGGLRRRRPASARSPSFQLRT